MVFLRHRIVFIEWYIELETKHIVLWHSIDPLYRLAAMLSYLSNNLSWLCTIIGRVLSEKEKLLDAGLKVRVRHPSYCETSLAILSQLPASC